MTSGMESMVVRVGGAAEWLFPISAPWIVSPRRHSMLVRWLNAAVAANGFASLLIGTCY